MFEQEYKSNFNSKEYDRKRGSSCRRGYDRKWQKLSATKLEANPLCECIRCQAGALKKTKATMVHHIGSIKIHPELRLVWSNLMSVSIGCHTRIHQGRNTKECEDENQNRQF